MFLVVKYHIIRPPPPPAWASLLNKPKSQKSLGHWISKNHGPWIPKNSWTMNFENFMDHEFPKIVGHWFSEIFGPWYFFLKNLKFSKIYGIMFWLNFLNIDFVWYCWYCWFCLFCRFFENLWKRVEKTFIFLIQSILFSNGGLLQRERERINYIVMRNFNNTNNKISII